MERVERILKSLKRARDWLLEQPVYLAAIVLFIAFGVVASWTNEKYFDPIFRENILVEAHGMLLDILVIGVFILALNQIGEKQRTIQRYQDEINDFRKWESEEAAHRITGNIRRMNRLGKTNIDLLYSYLKDMDLYRVDLRGAFLSFTNFQGADLRRAHFGGAQFKGAKLQNADLRGAQAVIPQTLAEAQGLWGAKLDPELEAEMRKLKPELFNSPFGPPSPPRA